MSKSIDVNEKLPLLQLIPLGLQHFCAMVGATILVPMITHMNPAIALMSSGVCTLIYILVTKGKLPGYIGSSFSFIGPMIIANAKFGQAAMQGGVIATGVAYAIIAALIYYLGIEWINKLMPPVVIGSIITVIGLSLAVTAVDWAGLTSAHSASVAAILKTVPLWAYLTVSFVTLAIGIIGSMYFKGFLGIIPILCAMICGYFTAMFLGVIPKAVLDAIVNAPLFAMPKFVAPAFNWNAMLLIAPVSVATLGEHIGHFYVTQNVIGKDLTKDPGLHRSILGDGFAGLFAGLVGAPPNTTYGENIGVMALTKVYSIWGFVAAAVIAIVLSFIGPVSVIVQNMPLPVMGGVSILLFGIIASSGLRIFVQEKVDFGLNKNLLVASVIIVLGVGGASINILGVDVAGVTLAAVIGIILNKVLPEKSAMEK